MYKPIGIMKHKYISPNTDTIKCILNNICYSSGHENDGETEDVLGKVFNDVWDEGWDEDEENNNLISSLWE